MLENFDKINNAHALWFWCMSSALTLWVRALDASNSQCACIILSKFTHQSKYVINNLWLFKGLKKWNLYLVGQAVFKLWIKIVRMFFGFITPEPLGLPKFWSFFWVPLTIYCKMSILFFKDVNYFEMEHRTY